MPPDERELSATRQFTAQTSGGNGMIMIQLLEYELNKATAAVLLTPRGHDTRKVLLMLDHSTLPLFSLQPETKEILLSQGKVAIVDAADFEWLSAFKWSASKEGNVFYATRGMWLGNGNQKSVRMHREILGVTARTKVDHKDGNGLNNTRDNLRPATQRQNGCNRQAQSNNTSGYKGVTWCKAAGKWQASIHSNGESIYIGIFVAVEDAARAYDAAAREIHGEFAWLNFSEG